jgi:arylsulfatase A-like enzyme
MLREARLDLRIGREAIILGPHQFAHRIGQTVLPNIRMKLILRLLPCFVLIFFGIASAAPDRPNIVVILTDDQGYADISFNPNHPGEVSTPHMDALAREGVFFSNAYTSGHVCSPTRAGLMLGRYQQRMGVYTAGDGGRGFDPKLPIFPSFLSQEYTSTAIGKWHLGLDNDYPELKWHAMNRGFDECYKFMGRGGHDYFKMRGVKGDDVAPIYRNKTRLKEGDYEGYMTTRLSEEAVAFIDREKANPFFLYLAYNAVHAPAQAPEEDIVRYRAQFPGISQKRATLMAMLHHLDLGIGSVVKKLKDEELWDNTLLFFLTDNGGSKAMEANNGRLRGFKGSLYEGGIRTPWVVSWPARFKGGRTIDMPIISIDILPTVLDATGVAETNFDGKSLLPLLKNESTQHHDQLYWNSGEPKGEWAVRQGPWKAHGVKENYELYDLKSDPSEEHNLAGKNPEKAKELVQLHEAWLKEMVQSAGAIGGERELQRTRRRAERKAAKTRKSVKNQSSKLNQETDVEPLFFVAEGLDTDGSLVKNYRRGLDYAIDYFGNYGPFNIYLLGPENEQSVRDIFRKRAKTRAIPGITASEGEQVEEFLRQSNIIAEIDAVLAGESTGGLTWSSPQRRVYEDVSTNATGRAKDPIENTWGALHEYHHVFQVAHSDSYRDRSSDKNLNSWMLEGAATYSSAKFMERLGLTDFKKYMLDLRTSGANIGRPGINDFLSEAKAYQLNEESYWDEGTSPQVYYMLGAWATAYLIHVQGIDEITVLKDWYLDVLTIGKNAAFTKHMKMTPEEFYAKFDKFIRQPDDEVMKIFEDDQP